MVTNIEADSRRTLFVCFLLISIGLVTSSVFHTVGQTIVIHYTCDRCKRTINTVDQPRYVVQIEIQSAVDDPLDDHPLGIDQEVEEDVDYLSELHQSLEGMSELPDEVADPSHHRGRYDLCCDCHRQFLKNPLGRDAMAAIGFSNN